MQASLPFGKIAGAFDPDLAEHGLQSPFMKPLLHAFLSIAAFHRRGKPRPDPELRRALPTAAASVPGLVSRVLVPNRFLSNCRPPSSPKTSPAPRSFHALAQRRHDRLPAEPTPLSTPSIAAPRRASEDKPTPSWVKPRRRSAADPFVPNRWSDPNQSSSPRGNTCRDTVADPPAFRPTAAPDHSAVSSPPRCVRRLALKSGSPNF